MSLRRGDDDYYYYIICVIVLRAKAEHALDTRYSADEQRATTTTRVLDGCCVPAGVTLQSSSSYALARSLAHPDRAGEPRTRPPTEDTPHIDRNLARSEPRPPISLTITNRRQGHTSRRYPRAQQHGEAYSPNFREFPSVRWTVGHSGAHRSIGTRATTFAAVRQFHAFRGIALFIEYSDCENRCIDRVFVGLLLEEVEQYWLQLWFWGEELYIYMFFVVIIKYHQNRVLLRSNEKASARSVILRYPLNIWSSSKYNFFQFFNKSEIVLKKNLKKNARFNRLYKGY